MTRLRKAICLRPTARSARYPPGLPTACYLPTEQPGEISDCEGRPNGNRFALMDHDRILRLSAVLWKTGLPKSVPPHQARRISPAGYAYRPRGVGWRGSEVERWIADPAGYGSGSTKRGSGTGKDAAPYPPVPVAGSAD